jgi:hypothetical protein
LPNRAADEAYLVKARVRVNSIRQENPKIFSRLCVTCTSKGKATPFTEMSSFPCRPAAGPQNPAAHSWTRTPEEPDEPADDAVEPSTAHGQGPRQTPRPKTPTRNRPRPKLNAPSQYSHATSGKDPECRRKRSTPDTGGAHINAFGQLARPLLMAMQQTPENTLKRLQRYGDDALDFEGRGGDKCELPNLVLSS